MSGVVFVEPTSNSGGWPPKTGAVPSPVPGFDTEIAWTADRGFMSSVYAGSPTDPPPDAEGVTVALAEEAAP